MPSPAYRLALFDFDGTLADSAPWFFAVLNDAARRHGFQEITPDERERLRSLDTRSIIRQLGIPLWRMPAIARDMRERVRRDIHLIRPFPFVPDALATLKRCGVTIAVVTSNDEDNVRRILGSAAETVSVMACGASLFGKAAKMRSVLKRTGLGPGSAMAIGDETRDVEAAREAGIPAAAVTWGYATREGLASAGPDFLVSSPDDLMRLIIEGPQSAPGRRAG